MGGVSSCFAKWCVKALALPQLGEPHVPQAFVCSFVADNTGATFVEDGGRASRCPWVDMLHLFYAAVLLRSGAKEVYVPAHHKSGSWSPLALRQASSDAGTKQVMERPCLLATFVGAPA